MKSITGMGGIGSAADLAEMLRQMGRGRDTVLAHITPEEAQMLLEQGGAGTTNPMTGLPEFLDIYGDQQPTPFYGGDVEAQAGGFYGNTPEVSFYPDVQATYRRQLDESGQPVVGSGRGERIADYFVPGGNEPLERFQARTMDVGFGPGRFAPEVSPTEIQGAPAADVERFTGQAPSTADRLAQFARENPRLFGYGAQGLIGALQAARMRQQTARDAERLRALGAPMRAEGENLRQQALAGNLTPQQARQLEASVARSRQAAAGRGVTTGTQEAMLSNVAQRTKADLLQTNLANSLKLLNLANAYDEAAIKAQLAADREADDLLADIFGNIAMDVSAGGQRQQAPTQPRPQPQARPADQEITRRPELPRG